MEFGDSTTEENGTSINVKTFVMSVNKLKHLDVGVFIDDRLLMFGSSRHVFFIIAVIYLERSANCFPDCGMV